MSPLSYCIVYLIGIAIVNGIDAINEETENESVRRSRDIAFLSIDCAAAELKVDKIDVDDQEIKFTWKGLSDSFFGTRYEVKCYQNKRMFDGDSEYQCTSSDISKLKKRKYKVKYSFSNSEYYCAVQETSSYAKKRSNIVYVRTPKYSRMRGGVIGGLVVGIIVFICLIVGFILCRRRRRGPSSYPGAVLTGNEPTATYNVVAPPPGGFQQPQTYPGAYPQQPIYPQQPLVYPSSPQQQPAYPPPTQMPPGYPPQPQSYQSWDRPPPYPAEYRDNMPPQPTAPEQNQIGFKQNYVS